MNWSEELPDHLPLLWTLIYQLQVPSYLRDEAFSEGLVAIVEATKSFDPSRGLSLRQWLFTKCRWYLLDWMRRSGRQSYDLLGDGDDPSFVENLEVRAETHEVVMVVRTVLTFEECIVFLAPASGYNAVEINQALGVNWTQQNRLRQEARQKVYHALGML